MNKILENIRAQKQNGPKFSERETPPKNEIY